MRNLYSNILYLLKLLFLAERSMNPGLDAPITAEMNDRFPFFGALKTIFWIAVAVSLSFAISTLK